MLSYKYRLYPNKEQQSKLWKHANKLNKLYNYFLNQRIEVYRKEKKSITHKQQQAELTQMRKVDKELQIIHSQVLQQVTLRLNNTYKAFFKNYKQGQGFPHFRSCKKFFGICYPQKGYSIEHNYFITKTYSKIKLNKHRKIKGNIKQVYITSENNKWYICITTDYDKFKVNINQSVGIDVGITNIAVTSKGVIYTDEGLAKYFDKRINKIKSRRDKKCKKGSRQFKFLSSVIQRLYGVKKRKISDFLHKLSYQLSQKYDTIFCEDLNLKDMSEGNITGISRELRNSQIAKFISYLQYKTRNLVEVDPKNTSKTCNVCGKIQKMPLYKRVYECKCGYKEDRDVNAAKNIYCLGRAFLETGKSVAIHEALSFR